MIVTSPPLPPKKPQTNNQPKKTQTKSLPSSVSPTLGWSYVILNINSLSSQFQLPSASVL